MNSKTYIKNLISEIMENNGDNETEFEGQALRLRCGEWTADDSGVRLEYIDSRGAMVRRTASAAPIMPTALLYDPESELASVELKTRVRGRWRTVVCPRSQISSAVKIVQLADKGIEVTSETAANLVKFLAEVISLNPDRIPERKTASRLGWFDGEFLPYAAISASSRSVGDGALDVPPASSGEEVSGDSPTEVGTRQSFATYINPGDNKHLLEPVREKGSLEKWVTGMAKYRESLAFRLMMGASFASPLLEPLNLQPFVFCLWGPTGCGKTLTLQAAMSVWGDPRIGGMTKTMNMTLNAMLSTSAFLRNLPFGGDELQIIKNRRENYDRLIMSCTEGMDRARMTYSSLNRTRTWRCAFLFTGEEPCVDTSSGGGAVNRVICVNAGADTCLPCRKVGEGDRDSGGRGYCSGDTPPQSLRDSSPSFGRGAYQSCLPYDRGAQNAVGADDPGRPSVSPAELAGLFSENYGSAGRLFIEEYQKDPSAAKRIYDEYFGKLVRLDATGKQASAMAAILTGDRLACEYLFKNETPISAETAARFMKSDTAVSAAKRAREFTEGLIAANVNMFSPGNISREIWGKIDGDTVLFNKTILCRELKNEGYSFEAVKNEWVSDGFLVRNPDGRFDHCTSCYGTKARYIKLQTNDNSIE